MKFEIETVGEYLYWAYANLAMAHAALSHEADKYERLHYSIRTKLYSGLCNGTMAVPAALHKSVDLIARRHILHRIRQWCHRRRFDKARLA